MFDLEKGKAGLGAVFALAGENANDAVTFLTKLIADKVVSTVMPTVGDTVSDRIAKLRAEILEDNFIREINAGLVRIFPDEPAAETTPSLSPEPEPIAEEPKSVFNAEAAVANAAPEAKEPAPEQEASAPAEPAAETKPEAEATEEEPASAEVVDLDSLIQESKKFRDGEDERRQKAWTDASHALDEILDPERLIISGDAEYTDQERGKSYKAYSWLVIQIIKGEMTPAQALEYARSQDGWVIECDIMPSVYRGLLSEANARGYFLPRTTQIGQRVVNVQKVLGQKIEKGEITYKEALDKAIEARWATVRRESTEGILENEEIGKAGADHISAEVRVTEDKRGNGRRRDKRRH